MRKLSITAICCFLILGGVYLLTHNKKEEMAETEAFSEADHAFAAAEENTILSQKKRRELDKIGTVINTENADLDHETRTQIRVAKKTYESTQGLKEKQLLLEQSYMDHASSIKDIKRIQDSIVEMKNRLHVDLTNTEKWDPKFVYYLMMQENYTYQEINQIKSLAENGLNAEEINYITELIKENAFLDKIQAFKGMGDRSVASIKKKPKEKDDFIDNPEEGASIESKLIEMNYNKEEKEEMVYGSTQQH